VVEASTSTAIDTIAKADAISGSGLVMDWTANTVTRIVTSLHPSRTYYFAVLVKDAAGYKSLYSPANVTTTTPTKLIYVATNGANGY